MREKEEIRSRISTIWKSITYVEVHFEAFYSIEDNLKANSSNSSNFFQLAGWSFRRIGIIEFAKLLSSKKGDDFRVENLLKQLAPNQYWGKLKIESSKIERWQVQLEEQKDSIETIITLRDEVYAHSDKASLGSDENYTYPSKESIFQLIELVKEIVEGLYSDSNLCDGYADTRNPFEMGREIDCIFKRLEEVKRIKQSDVLAEINSSKL